MLLKAVVVLLCILSVGYCGKHFSKSCGKSSSCLSMDQSLSLHQTRYWYNSKTNRCVLLDPSCILPNYNSTFGSLMLCIEACSTNVQPSTADKDKSSNNNCKNGKCDKDLAPTVTTLSTSTFYHPASLIASIVGCVAIIGIVIAVSMLAMYRLIKTKHDRNLHKMKLANMLTTLSDPNDYSDEDSFDDDNLEDYNLFDRLEQSHY